MNAGSGNSGTGREGRRRLTWDGKDRLVEQDADRSAYEAGFQAAVKLLRDEARFEEYFQQVAHKHSDTTLVDALPTYSQSVMLAGFLDHNNQRNQ
jgi:hypothetical protein